MTKASKIILVTRLAKTIKPAARRNVPDTACAVASDLNAAAIALNQAFIVTDIVNRKR